MMKKMLMLCALAFLCCTGAARADEVETLLSGRTTTVWIEGEQLGDMIIGARALMEFIYVDAALSRIAVENGPDVPEWLTWHAKHFGTRETRKKALLIVRFEARKRWTFEPMHIRVNGRSLEEADILSKKEFIPTGELPAGSSGSFAICIPAAKLDDGKGRMQVRYGEYEASLTLPGKK